MPDRDGVLHGFMPLDGSLLTVAEAKKAEADVHADEVMLMKVGAQAADRAQNRERVADLFLREVKPTPSHSGKTAQQVIAASLSQAFDGRQMRNGSLRLSDMNEPQRKMPA